MMGCYAPGSGISQIWKETEEFNDIAESVFDGIGDNYFSRCDIYRIDKNLYPFFNKTFQAAVNTLHSSMICAKAGNFADAMMLLRKFRDDIMQFLWIHKVMDETPDGSNLPKELFIMLYPDKKTDKQKELDKWFLNELPLPENKSTRKSFSSNSYKTYLTNKSTSVSTCISKLSYKDKSKGNVWRYVDRLYNDFTHSNGIKYVLANGCDTMNIEENLLNFKAALDGICVLLISIITLLNSTVLMATDYIDYLDRKKTPPEGSQKWVMSEVQTFIDKYGNQYEIIDYDGNLKQFLKENMRYKMDLE